MVGYRKRCSPLEGLGPFTLFKEPDAPYKSVGNIPINRPIENERRWERCVPFKAPVVLLLNLTPRCTHQLSI